MSLLFIPTEAGGWRFHLTVLLLMVVPMTAVVEVGASPDDLPMVAALRTVVVAVALLVTTVALYIHHRVTGLSQSGWVCVAVGLAAVPTMSAGVYAWSHDGVTHQSLTALVTLRVVQMLLMLGCLLLARRTPLPVDGLALATVLGLCLFLFQHLIARQAGVHAPSSGALTLAGIVLGLVTLATGLPLLSIRSLPAWLRARGFLALGLIGVSTALDPMSTTEPFAAAAGLVTAFAGAMLVASSAVAYVHLALAAASREVTELERAMELAESGSRAARVRLSEIDSTVAGIASASRLLQSTPDLSQGRREVLSGMVAAEVARLQRLVAGPPAAVADLPEDDSAGPHRAGRSDARTVALDEVVGRMALMHRARGSRIEWTVCGLRVSADVDHLAAILDVLLHNAAQHGSPDRIGVFVRRVDATALVSVVDDGPGVAPEDRARLFFPRGSDRRPGGLSLARERARMMRGDLWLADSAAGARFVLRLELAGGPVAVSC